MAALQCTWPLQVPPSVSNFVLRTLVPDDTMGSDKAIVARVNDLYHLKDYDLEFYGGISEGVNFPATMQVKTGKPFHDEDCSVFLINKKHTVGPDSAAFAQVEQLEGGLAKVKVKHPSAVHPSLTVAEDGGTYLRSDVFLHSIPDMDTGSCIPYPDSDTQNVRHRNVKTSAWSCTCALRCVKWPEVASKWEMQQRRNGFPSAEFMERVRSLGCLLVPYSPGPGEWEGAARTEWSFSFVNVERKLMNSLTTLQKHIFLLFKIICFQRLGSPRIVEGHHLRAVFLRSCEKVPADMWTPEQLTQLLMFNMDSLLYAFIDNILPGYVNTDTNLIGHLSTDFLDEMQILISDMKVNCIKAVFEFCQQFPLGVTTPKWLSQSVLQPIGDHVTPAQGTSDFVIRVIASFLIRYAFAFADPDAPLLVNESFGILRLYHKLISQFVVSQQNEDQENEDIIWGIALQHHEDDLLWQIRVHEYIIKHANSPNENMFRNNLACHYHVWFLQGHQEYKTKAKDMFLSCVSSMNDADRMDYAVFLCKTEEWELAKDILIPITYNEEYKNANYYNKQELVTLETSIQDLGRALSGLTRVLPRSHAFYLLLVCYNMLNDADLMADNTLLRFNETCQAADAISQSLLALAQEKAGMYNEAVAIYQRVQRNVVNDRLSAWAHRKQQMCLNMVRLKLKEDGMDDDDIEALSLQLQLNFLSETSKSNNSPSGSTTVLSVTDGGLEIHSLVENGKVRKDSAMASAIRLTDTATEPLIGNEIDDLDEDTQLKIAIAISLQSAPSSKTNWDIADDAMLDSVTPEEG